MEPLFAHRRENWLQYLICDSRETIRPSYADSYRPLISEVNIVEEISKNGQVANVDVM